MNYALIKRFEKKFNENLHVTNGVNIGTLSQSDNNSSILTVYVPGIEEENDTCYMSVVLPARYITQINIPKTLNQTFEFAYTENNLDYYKAEFKLDSRITKFVGQVSMNLVILHKTGEYSTIIDDLGEKQEIEKVITITSDTLSLNIEKSSNFISFSFSTAEELEEAGSLVTELIKGLSSFPNEYIKKSDGIICLDSLPTNLLPYAEKCIFVRDSGALYTINENGNSKQIYMSSDQLQSIIKTQGNTAVIIDIDNITDKDYYYKIDNSYFNNKKPVVIMQKANGDNYDYYTCQELLHDEINLRYKIIYNKTTTTQYGATIQPLVVVLYKDKSQNTYTEEEAVNVSSTNDLTDMINNKIRTADEIPKDMSLNDYLFLVSESTIAQNNTLNENDDSNESTYLSIDESNELSLNNIYTTSYLVIDDNISESSISIINSNTNELKLSY